MTDLATPFLNNETGKEVLAEEPVPVANPYSNDRWNQLH